MIAIAVAISGAFALLAQAAPASPPGSQGSVYAARTTDIPDCVQRVADESASKPFDQVLDQAVQRCGGLIPFPVPPRELAARMTEQQIHDSEERHERTRRGVIGRALRQALRAKPAPLPGV